MVTISIIRAALGLSPGLAAHDKLIERLPESPARECIVQSVVLEAEMVAYSEVTGDIDSTCAVRCA
jgi:hypothetical protein